MLFSRKSETYLLHWKVLEYEGLFPVHVRAGLGHARLESVARGRERNRLEEGLKSFVVLAKTNQRYLPFGQYLDSNIVVLTKIPIDVDCG